jgi:hypothetical protein
MPDHMHLPVWGNVADIFATELTAVEALGPCVRLVFTVPVQDGSEAHRDHVACIVIPTMVLPSMMQQLGLKPRPIAKGEPEACLEEEAPFRETLQ